MSAKLILGSIVFWLLTLALAGCVERHSDLFEVQSVELASENTRLQDELNRVTDALIDLRNEQQGFYGQQIISQPVRFAGGGDTLLDVIDRKVLRCGGNADLPGFGYLDPDSSEYNGLDIDICRALGAAILGNQGAAQIQITPLTSKLRFTSLQSGEIDVLTRNTTWTLKRDTELRVNFAGITFYDGQGVLVRRSDGIKKLSDLENKAVCVQASSTSANNIRDYFDSVGITLEIREFEDRIAALRQYDSAACEGYTGDKSSLIAQQTLLSRPDEHIILLGEISREPLGPIVLHGDDNWHDVVTWTVQCLINAEALGVSQLNVNKMKRSEDLAIKRLLGVEGQLGKAIGLSNDFCYEIIQQVGNYKDIYDRHLGPDTPFNLARGLNALYSDGGLMYPLPMK